MKEEHKYQLKDLIEEYGVGKVSNAMADWLEEWANDDKVLKANTARMLQNALLLRNTAAAVRHSECEC